MKLYALFIGLVALSEVTSAQSADKHQICSERVTANDCASRGRFLNANKPCCRNTNSCLSNYEQSKCGTSFCCDGTAGGSPPPPPVEPPVLPPTPPTRPPITQRPPSTGAAHETKFNDPSTIPQTEYPDVRLGNYPKYNPFTIPRNANTIRRLSRGQTIRGYTILADGVYNNAQITVDGRGAVLRAESLHGAVFTGEIKITIRNGGVVDGLFFDGAAPSGTGIIEIANGRVTNCRFLKIGNPRGYREGSSQRHRCITQTGAYSLVDHNSFEDICTASLTINMSARAGNSITYRNYFSEQCEKYTAEVWRTGSSNEVSIFAKAFCDENLFTKQRGEHELLSLKCGGIYVRGNTVTDSRGAITCRHGSNNVLTDNWYQCGRTSSGAIRIFGENHVVTGNYAENCGAGTYGVLAIGKGDNCSPDNGRCGYMRVRNTRVENNTCMNCGKTISFGGAGKGGTCPVDTRMRGNYNNRGPEVTEEGRNGTCRAPRQTNRASRDQSRAVRLNPRDVGPVRR
eukprot:Awhi_evm1s7788